MKNRVLHTIAAFALTMAVSGVTFVDHAWAQAGTAAGPGAGGGSGAGASGGSSGGSSGGGGEGASAASAAGSPGDSRLAADPASGPFFASTSPMPFRRLQSSGGLTSAQARTWDAFGQCATAGSMIDQLRVDGSFTFDAATQSDAHAIKDCMTRIGYRFDY